MPALQRYLLVTHIPFARGEKGHALLDALWARDLAGLIASLPDTVITIAAPEHPAHELTSWGTALTDLHLTDKLRFLTLPVRKGRLDLGYSRRVRAVLRRAAEDADLVHTSNLFEPMTDLYAAHDHAVRLGRRTLFVVAEDFVDMLGWEWVRTAPDALTRLRRKLALQRTDKRVRRRIAEASLTFLHTPAAVARYKSVAQNPVAIRQPVHEASDVITAEALEARLTAHAGKPLHIVAACRLKPLKGLTHLIDAVAILRKQHKRVRATIYGSGPQHDELAAKIAALHLEDRITLAGPLAPGAPLHAALNAADVFAMPHLTTDFGRAFWDAMSAGLPVVAYRNAASQETVADHTDGLLADNARPAALAEALGRYADNPVILRKHSIAARERALDNTLTLWNARRTAHILALFETPTPRLSSKLENSHTQNLTSTRPLRAQ